MKYLLPFLLLVSSLIGAELTLTWSDNSTNETGFQIDRSLDGSSWLPIWQVAADVVTWTDGGLLGETEYFYRVAAFNAVGHSGWSNTASETTLSDDVPNGTPPVVEVGAVGGSLLNLSTRGPVLVDPGPMIGGFVISGDPIPVLIRAVGPGLTQFGVSDVLTDPQVSLKADDGTTILENDDWNGQGIIDASIAVGAFPLTPGSKDSAILISLPAGSYTAHVSGVGGLTGTALLEIYHVK